MLVVLENIYKLIIGFAEKHALDHQGDILTVDVIILDVFLKLRRLAPVVCGRLVGGAIRLQVCQTFLIYHLIYSLARLL